jgi:hypothetical protein
MVTTATWLRLCIVYCIISKSVLERLCAQVRIKGGDVVGSVAQADIPGSSRENVL